jgi:hypothetical protein
MAGVFPALKDIGQWISEVQEDGDKKDDESDK